MSEESTTPWLRRIRSYVRREGRMTPSQASALQQWWPQYGLELEHGMLDLATVFARTAPCVVDIGFGNGASLLQLAQANPDSDFIGIDVHRPGVGSCLDQLHKQAMANVRLFCGDAIDVLQHCVADHSLQKVLLFFPDPWPKKRHHKRRIVQPAFARLVASKLKPGGQFHIATDWQNYAEHIDAVMATVTPELFQRESTIPPGSRPPTKYEQRGLRLGHEVWDFLYTAR